MKWAFCFSNGKTSKRPTKFQIDLVGNIVQHAGGVQPRACQKCKTVFKSNVVKVPINQPIVFYTCKNCDFKSLSTDDWFFHKEDNPKHKINRTTKDRLVGNKLILKG